MLPGERITAYENSAPAAVMPHTVGFKIVKRSGASSGGPSLADCPNGMWFISYA